jgi:hypothetical protein
MSILSKDFDRPTPRPENASSRAPLEILYVGEHDFFGPEPVNAFKAAGHPVHDFVSAAEAAEAVSQQRSAACILMAFQLAAKDIRALIELLGNSIDGGEEFRSRITRLQEAPSPAPRQRPVTESWPVP